MKTLWTFGDSMTFGHGCREDCPNNQYYLLYKQEGNDIWPNILANKLNSNIINLGKSGASNDYIIDSIIDNFNDIKENDYVVIGKTFHERFDVPDKQYNVLRAVFGEIKDIDINKDWFFWFKNEEQYRTQEEIETLINFNYYYSSNLLYKERQDKRFDFLSKRLEERNVKVFSWQNGDSHKDKLFERIINHTKGKIPDYHFSFKGHKDFSEYFYSKIMEEKKII